MSRKVPVPNAPDIVLTYRIVPELHVRGRRLELTRIEERILTCLLASQEQLASLDSIRSQVWPGEKVLVHTLHTHLSSLRRKLAAIGWTVRSVRGRGYKLGRASKR